MRIRKRTLLVGVLLLVACASQKSKFNQVKTENSIVGYQAFLQKYPNGEYTKIARANLSALEYEQAKEQNTLAAYEYFLETYPDTKYTDQVQNKIETIELNRAIMSNSSDSLMHHLKKYPNSNFKNAIDFIFKNRTSTNYSNDLDNAHEVIELKNKAMAGNAFDTIGHLAKYLEDDDGNKRNRALIQNTLFCCIYGSEFEDKYQLDQLDKLLDLREFYDSDSLNFPEFSFEFGLVRELQVKFDYHSYNVALKNFDEFIELYKKESNQLIIDTQNTSAKSINEYYQRVAKLQAEHERKISKLKAIAKFKLDTAQLVYINTILSVVKDLEKYKLSNNAKIQYCELYKKMIKNGIYASEYGIEENKEFESTIEKFYTNEEDPRVRKHLSQVITLLRRAQ